MAKSTIVYGQLIPILCDGWEAFEDANKEITRLGKTWSRWVIGACQGANALMVEAVSGIDNLNEWFRNRKIRWAASVCGRHLPAL